MATPCGYFMAGHCRYGASCSLRHSVPYAMAIRNEWLHPEEEEARVQLTSIATHQLGENAAQLFPRVFSRRLSSPNGAGSWQWPGGLRYLLVLDLEGKDEITEFPVIVLDMQTRCELGRFQRYARPVRLFDGLPIEPDSPAIPFGEILAEFDGFLQGILRRTLANLGGDAALLTCGDWDCRHVRTQCGISGVPLPAAFERWVNVKRSYEAAYGGTFRGMRSMLARLRLLDRDGNVTHGFHHLGMHDVENICRCALALLNDGHAITINGPLRR